MACAFLVPFRAVPRWILRSARAVLVISKA
jgi:hypothetical protein